MTDDDRPRDKPVLYPPNVAKPPPPPQAARELPNKDVKGYELDLTDRKAPSRRASTVNSGDGVPVRSGARGEPAGGGWVRAAVLLLILVAASIGAYWWKGR